MSSKNNFPHNLLLTCRQVSGPRKAFPNSLSKDIKLSKTQLPKITRSGRFFSRLPGLLLKVVLVLLKNVLHPWAKSVLITFGLAAAAWAADAKIYKNILGSGTSRFETTALVISNGEIQVVVKIVRFLKDSEALHKGVAKIIEKEIKEQRRGFLSMDFSWIS